MYLALMKEQKKEFVCGTNFIFMNAHVRPDTVICSALSIVSQ